MSDTDLSHVDQSRSCCDVSVQTPFPGSSYPLGEQSMPRESDLTPGGPFPPALEVRLRGLVGQSGLAPSKAPTRRRPVQKATLPAGCVWSRQLCQQVEWNQTRLCLP